MRARVPCLIVGALLSASPSPGLGQEVRGTAVEAASGAAIDGAFVTLLDQAGAAVASSLTGVDGAFVLRASARATYRLRVERIGFASWTSEPFEAGPGRSVTRHLPVPVEAVTLEDLAVTVESRCADRPRAGLGLARAWEEARKALEVTRWTERETAAGFELRRWTRALAAGTERVKREETLSAEKRAWHTFVSAPAEELSAEGYVRRAADGAWRFFAPDAEVLLSGAFADDHCFSLVEGRGKEEGLVGLSFEPAPDRRTSDVRGVLWLHATTSELRHLSFTYTNTGLERPLDRYPAGRRVEFARLPTGHWFVRRWHLRMPVAGERTGVGLRRGPGGGALQPRRETVLAEIREVGGEVVRATLPDGGSVRLAEWGGVEGTVRDGSTGDPVTGIEVEVAGAAYRGRTDARGRYRIEPVPPGDYTLTARRPEFEPLGVAGVERAVAVLPGARARADLELPSPGAVLAEVCGGPGGGEADEAATAGGRAEAAAFGRVRDRGSGEPVPGARVWIADHGWAVRERAPPGRADVAPEWTGVAVEADGAGVYLACGIPGGAALVAQAGTPTAASDTARLATGPGELLRLDFELVESRRPLARFEVEPEDADLDALVDEILAAADEEDPGRAALVGTVRSAEEGRPVAGARVRLLERDEERVTGPDGAFVMAGLPRARYRVVTDHLGMTSDTAEVDLRVGSGQVALFTLETRPIELPALHVEIERTLRSPRLAGFYERMRRGLGDFITREDLEARDVVANFRRIPGVRVDQCVGVTGLRKANCWTIKIARGLSGRVFGGDGRCPPLVYIDGRLASAPSSDEYLADSLKVPGENAFTLLQQLPRTMLEGIEVYRSPAGAPAQYRMLGDACGLVLVWTRGR